MPGANPVALDVALTALGTDYMFISLHSADPGTTGASEITGGSYVRVATTWAAASAAAMAGSQVTINVPAGTTIAYWGIWSASTGGVWFDGGQLPAPQTYATAGTFNLTPTVTAAG